MFCSNCGHEITGNLSHPSRVRGLKDFWSSLSPPLSTSHPSRVRGLKASRLRRLWRPDCVAPFTGAWIERHSNSHNSPQFSVAPFTGAWIERSNQMGTCIRHCVAPFTGAWIERRCVLFPTTLLTTTIMPIFSMRIRNSRNASVQFGCFAAHSSSFINCGQDKKAG